MLRKKMQGKDIENLAGMADVEGVESFLAEYNKSIKNLREGQIIKGKIVGVTHKDVLVDIGYKSEGIIPLNEFEAGESVQPGEEIDILLESKEDENGMVVISKRKADRTLGWQRIIDNFREGDVIEGKVMKKVRGGLMVDIGIEAFLPASQAGNKAAVYNLDKFVGQRFKTIILKINKSRKNIVLSRRVYLQKEKELLKKKLFEELGKGQIIEGTVKNITDFGAFIDLGGVDGLLHITDMSWGRISHPSEMLAIGDKVEVMVLGIDKGGSKISLGLKQKFPSPWEDVENKYPVGSKVKGKVVNIVAYGAFIEMESGIEGLVHISELSWTKRITHPSEMLAIGDIVEAKVLSLDKEHQKIALGIKHLEVDPWQGVAQRYPAGTKVKGKIRNATEYGVFVELETGIEGLIHISDMSWTKKITTLHEFLKKGQKVETIVLSTDEINHKISLGLKQLTDDPWPSYTKKYVLGSEWEGTISAISEQSISIELTSDLEGILTIPELNAKPETNLQLSYNVGDTIKVKIAEIDEPQRKILLVSAR
ncbi:MAG: 30S ribosomal protein S1 [Candidatus Omnitrophota bacterium]